MRSLSPIHEAEASPATRLAFSPPDFGVPHAGSATADGTALEVAYRSVRRRTEALCEPLASEDYVVQPMPDASPVKWHLAHTAWFFETFVLKPHCADYRVFEPKFELLFNSYYNAVGPRWPRHQRGLLSRPTVAEVYAYRRHVDQAVGDLLAPDDAEVAENLAATVQLGL